MSECVLSALAGVVVGAALGAPMPARLLLKYFSKRGVNGDSIERLHRALYELQEGEDETGQEPEE